MSRFFHVLLLVAAIVLGAIGISRLSYNVEILDLLPKGLPGVEGTKLFQKIYERPEQLIVTLKAGSPEAAEHAAESLAGALAAEPGLARKVRWHPSWEEHPEELTYLTAYAWWNASPEDVEKLAGSLRGDQISHTLQARLEKLASSMDPMDMALDPNDPLGFASVLKAGIDEDTMKSMGGGGFAGPDGTFRVLLVDAQSLVGGYRGADQWLAKARQTVGTWQKAHPEFSGVALAYTGSPVFLAQIGMGMEGDLQQSVSWVTLIVGFLFWLLHRSLRPLFLIVAALIASFLITLGAAGLAFGSLNVMSMGFAAILMGTIEDFGVMGLHEAMREPGLTFRQVHGRVFPSIAWSALTTAAVFWVLGLSALPGIAQMGWLTGFGMLIGAAVMLYGFLPLAMKWGRLKPHVISRPGPERAPAWPGWAGIAVIAACAAVLVSRGLPGASHDASVLRPKSSDAFRVLEDFEREMKPDGGGDIWLPVVVKADDDMRLAAALRETATVMRAARDDGSATGYYLPLAFAPDPAHQQRNAPVLTALAADRGRLLRAVDEAGFNERGQALAKGVLEQWAKWAADGQPHRPDLVLLDDILGRQLRSGDDGRVACGFIKLRGQTGALDMPVVKKLENLSGTHIAGWEYLASRVRVLMGREVHRVLLPSACVLLFFFLFVFRGWHERVIAVASLAFSGLVLVSGMRLMNIDWNFINIGAVPLCLGLGLDFNIHVIFSLRNSIKSGDNGYGVGRALAYCGLSTGLGFGAIAMSDNAGLASLGVCSMIGVFATLFTAAFLVPWAWYKTRPS